MTPSTPTLKKLGVLAGGMVACIVAAASVAWACVAAEGPYVNELFAKRVPVGAEFGVSGSHWAANAEVQLGVRTTPSQPLQSLGTAVTDQSGSFSAQLRVPDVSAGYYYLAVTQGDQHAATPFEILATSGSETAPGAQTVAAGSGQLWNGLRAGAQSQGLGDVAPASSGSSLPLGLMVALAGGVVVLAGALVAEVRRPVRVRTRD